MALTRLGTNAITTVSNSAITLDAAEIPNLDTAKITTGTLADARIAASNVTQHVTATDLQPLKSDLSALALREATNEASAAFNLPNQFIETFTDDTNLGTQTTGDRVSGYWATISSAANATAYRYYKFIYTVPSSNSHPKVYEIFFYPSVSGGGSEISKSGATTTVQVGSQYSGSNGLSSSIDGNTATVMWFDTGTANLAYTIDFGSGVTQTVASIKYHWQQHVLTTNIKMYGSNNNSDFTLVLDQDGDQSGGVFIDGPAGGVLSAAYDTSVASTSATGTLIQAANTVGSAKTKVGGTMLYKDNAGTATLGTDLKIYFSCNNGGAWTEAASYNAITPVYSTGIKQVRLGETTCTSGTGIIYKAVWANQVASSKETQLHGIGVNY